MSNGKGLEAMAVPVSLADLKRLIGGGGGVKPTPEDATASAIEEYDRIVGEIGRPCPDPEHRRVHETCVALLGHAFRTSPIPEAIREVFVQAYVSVYLHKHEHVSASVAGMLADDGKMFSDMMLVVGAVARHLGVTRTGGAVGADAAAAAVAGGGVGGGVDADMRAGYL